MEIEEQRPQVGAQNASFPYNLNLANLECQLKESNYENLSCL
jgi:hypothetical protein